METVKILLETEGCMPEKNHEDDMGYDLRSAERVFIKSGETQVVSAGFKIALPVEKDYIWEAQIRPRSGMSLKTGIRIANSPGTIDSGYRGTVGIIIHNTDKNNHVINKGDKIAQMIITRSPKVLFEQVDELNETERNEKGFGSSGK